MLRQLLLVTLFLSSPLLAQDSIVDTWRYTLRKPADGWKKPVFDDSGWKEGSGGFGTHGTPQARIGTVWQTNNIWLRKTFELKVVPARPALFIHHDEDTEVILNGKHVISLKGWTTEYHVIPLDKEFHSTLRTGENVLAVHCRQNGGGQFIDVHVVDADNVPKLPPAKRNTTPFQSELMTQWGEEVTAENAWTEYPRPAMARKDWQNLNGHWDYAITAIEQNTVPGEWSGKILVPYPLESKLGGVQRLLDQSEALWYHRTFQATKKENQRTLLNFEAVDYRCDVILNGLHIGQHQGGNTPFTLDATSAIQTGQNELIVRVEDETEGWQLHGKQSLNPHGIWYTQVSGIWQTVWLEQVDEQYLEDLKITTDSTKGTITVQPKLSDGAKDVTVHIHLLDGDKEVATTQSQASSITLTIPEAKLWSPSSPHLYELNISLIDKGGVTVDKVTSYAGIRSVGKQRDQQGHLRLTLNRKELFHWGPLDQGWWPDGLLTPPSDEAMLFDIEYLKSAGFNMIRKHIKVEPRRYYYHCDRLGMLVWQDQVSGGANPKWTRLAPNPEDAIWPAKEHKQFMLEFERMIDELENHPCIVVWTPFNEAWGQHQTMEVGQWTVERDPTRTVNIASGGNFWPVGDVVDHHSYPNPEFHFDPDRYKDFIKVVGEFGGHGYPVKDHLWDADRRNWGYGGLPKNEAEYKQRYITSLEKLYELRRQGIAAGVYTQTTDVEGEINGLMTYDRRVIKIPAKALRELHQQLFE